MQDPLREIFEHFQDIHSPTEKYWALSRVTEDILDQIRPVMGRELVDDLLHSCANVNFESEYEWFLEGLRLGVALMLEARSFPA